MTAASFSRRAVLGGAAIAGGLLILPGRPATGVPDRRPRLVLMLARGGMDGLSLTPPLCDPHYRALRGPAGIDDHLVLPFDTDFGLHPRLSGLSRLAHAGQMRLAPAAALWAPDRSHFRAQNLLELGDLSAGLDSGWLGRAAGRLLPGGGFAMGLGPAPPLVLQNRLSTANWSLDQPATSGFVLDTLDQLYAEDGDLASAARNLRSMSGVAESRANPAGGAEPATPADRDPTVRTAALAARFLAPAAGASIAVLSFYGFDTHTSQGGVQGRLADSFERLDRGVEALRLGLGPAWAHTLVVIVTEFGRTVALNGRGGSDHGTASSALLVGGAVRRGGLLGEWPGLSPSALYEGRDLRPGLDLRALLKGVLAEHFGAEAGELGRDIFPGSADVAPLVGLAGRV